LLVLEYKELKPIGGKMSAIKDLKDFAGQFTPGGPYLETPELMEKIDAVDKEGFWRGFISGGSLFTAAIVITFIAGYIIGC